MFIKSNLINLEPFSQSNNKFLRSVISKANKNFFHNFSIKNIKLSVYNEEIYRDFQYLLTNKIKDSNANQHQDFANFRLFFEANLIIRNFKLIDGIISNYIIDVGASTRLTNHLISKIALRPVLDCQDYIRTNKFNMSLGLVLNLTFQQFIEKYYDNIRSYKPIFNFTDVLYYISETDLVNYTRKMENGLVGMGTLHIFKNHSFDITQDLLGLGIITMEEKNINMKVVGNETVYRHNVIFSCLKDMDYYNIKADGYYLNIIKQLSVDFQSTVYVSFLIVKSNQCMFSPTLYKSINNTAVNNNIKEEQIIQKAIINYKSSYKITYNELLKQDIINEIINKFLYNVNLNNIYRKIRKCVIEMSVQELFN